MNNPMERNMPLPKAFISTTTTKLLSTLQPLIEHSKVESHENRDLSLSISHLMGDSDENLIEVITSYIETLSHSKMHVIGYPTNQDFNYDALGQLLHFHINNAGDPFIKTSFALNSTSFEICVLDWFAKLWEIAKNDYWGYITTGGTEGNLHGIFVGREKLPDGILYTSQESHYSVFKIARMYKMQCVKVATLPSGEIDYADLKVSLIANKDKSAIINLNIGTTMKGAIDDVDHVVQTLKECGFPHDRFYIHCDGALSGITLPFVKRAPSVSFKQPVGSISVSGHKFLGCPFPCGVILTRLEYIDILSKDIEYIASRDATITGSRNGLAPIFLWFALKKKGLIGIKNEVEKCIDNAIFLQDQLQQAGIGVMKNEFSNTVVFERPLDDGFSRKWSLACKGNIAHVVVMQHVTIEMLDSFVSEFVQKRLTWFQDGQNQLPLCIADEVGADNCACKLHN